MVRSRHPRRSRSGRCDPPAVAPAGRCRSTAAAEAPRPATQTVRSAGRSPGSRIRRFPSAFPGASCPVAERRKTLRLQLRGQPRRWGRPRTAFPFHPPDWRDHRKPVIRPGPPPASKGKESPRAHPRPRRRPLRQEPACRVRWSRRCPARGSMSPPPRRTTPKWQPASPPTAPRARRAGAPSRRRSIWCARWTRRARRRCWWIA